MPFYKNKVVWVTGASSGIGEALVHELLKLGALVILSARRENELRRVEAEALSAAGLSSDNPPSGSSALSEHHPHRQHTLVLPLDLAKPESFSEAVVKALSWKGHVDMLINNGGVSQRALSYRTTLNVERQIFEVNYFGTVELTRTLIPHMIKRKSGHICVISSVLGKLSVPGSSTYCATKHALHGYFDALRAEVHRHKIKVCMVCPGFIRTNVSINALKADGGTHSNMDKSHRKAMDPFRFSRKMLRKVAAGREEFSLGGPEIYAIYMKRWFPWLVSRIIRHATSRIGKEEP